MAKNSTIIQTRYDSTHCKNYHLKLHLTLDADIIKKLASVPSMQGYIKQLIRDDINRSRPLSEKMAELTKKMLEVKAPDETEGRK